ncbi:MAG: hypothetical protein OXH04_08315 [Acidobacteria bacterium]|nr:hypothetical protein [Acidobacteriota bacterium]
MRAAEETYVRRLVREDTRRLEAAQFQRWKDLILLDTTELLRVMPRKLHAAWAELSGTRTRMSPAVADELAPAGPERFPLDRVQNR